MEVLQVVGRVPAHVPQQVVVVVHTVVRVGTVGAFAGEERHAALRGGGAAVDGGTDLEEAAAAKAAADPRLEASFEGAEEGAANEEGAELAVAQAGVVGSAVQATDDVLAVTTVELENAAEELANALCGVGYAGSGVGHPGALAAHGHALERGGDLGAEGSTSHPGPPVWLEADLQQGVGEAGGEKEKCAARGIEPVVALLRVPKNLLHIRALKSVLQLR